MANTQTLIAKSLQKENERLKEENKMLLDTLKKIHEWQFPETGQYWDKECTQPMSYAAAYGSNGERDYIRKVALDAIAKANPSL